LLQELGKQNPQIMQLIQENLAFLRLINDDPADGAVGYGVSISTWQYFSSDICVVC